VTVKENAGKVANRARSNIKKIKSKATTPSAKSAKVTRKSK
jgi:hypothetical protein